MALIIPAVLASDPGSYQQDLDVAVALSDRIQIDLGDQEFAANKTINLAQAYWPDNIRADLHLMYESPTHHLEQLISMAPHLVIIHFEAEDSMEMLKTDMLSKLSEVDIKTGVALLPDSSTKEAALYIEQVDHVLIFTGELGHYGGTLRQDCLVKIKAAKQINRMVEVGVDGGINDETITDVLAAGADVLNVGSFIQEADDPAAAYAKLQDIAGGVR